MHKYKITAIVLMLVFGAFLPDAVSEEVLTWQDCIREAQKNHPDLISAQENVKQLEATKRTTVSSLLPQINSNVDATRTGTTSTSSSGTTTRRTSNSYSYGASGTQLLFDGFKTLDNVKAASENVKAAQFNYKFTSSGVRLRLRTAFINLLKAQESLNITKQIYDIRKSNLDLISLRYKSGAEHKGALLTAQANLAQAGFDVTQANRALETAQRQLIKEIGRTRFSPLRADGAFKVSDLVKEKPDLELLAKNNPSLEKLTAQKNAAYYGVNAARANYFPELSASGGIDESSGHWPPEGRQWNAGLSVSLPIFEGGLRSSELAQARAVYNQAQQNERSTRDAVVLALEQAWAAFQDAAETIEVQKKFLEAAEERAKIAESQYSLGLLQFDNWTIIEDDLVSTKKAYLNAQANALLAEANWVQAKGDTLEYAQ